MPGSCAVHATAKLSHIGRQAHRWGDPASCASDYRQEQFRASKTPCPRPNPLGTLRCGIGQRRKFLLSGDSGWWRSGAAAGDNNPLFNGAAWRFTTSDRDFRKSKIIANGSKAVAQDVRRHPFERRAGKNPRCSSRRPARECGQGIQAGDFHGSFFDRPGGASQYRRVILVPDRATLSSAITPERRPHAHLPRPLE